MSQIPDDASSMSDDVFEDQETTERRIAEARRRNQEQNPFYSNNEMPSTSGSAGGNAFVAVAVSGAATLPTVAQVHHGRTAALSSGYPGYRPPREALQMYALEDATYRLNTADDEDDYDDGWRSYRYEEVGMGPSYHHHHHQQHHQQQPFDDTVNHKTILLGDSGVGKTSFLVKYNTGEFRLGSFSATVGIALTTRQNANGNLNFVLPVNAVFDNNYNSYDISFRVVLAGDAGTGKTCMLLQFVDGSFFSTDFGVTVGADVRNKVVIVDGTRVKLQIWDTAGQERFRSVTHAYYRDAHALLLLYDVTNKVTFDNIRAWLAEIRDYAQDDVVILLIGNKADSSNSDRQVKREDGERLSREHNVPFMETSAKTGQNVELAFAAIARQLKCRGSGFGDAERFNVHDFVRDNTKAHSACMQCKYQ